MDNVSGHDIVIVIDDLVTNAGGEKEGENDWVGDHAQEAWGREKWQRRKVRGILCNQQSYHNLDNVSTKRHPQIYVADTATKSTILQ